MYVVNKEKVRSYMNKKGYNTQQELADDLEISKNQLSILLSSKYNPVKTNVLKICEKLDVKFDDIISEQLELSLDLDQGIANNVKKIDDNFIDIRNVKPNHNYKVLELFAGAGGLALGLEKAGFETIGLVENDNKACDTLRHNRPDWNIFESDIEKLTDQDLVEKFNINVGELDLLSGGYPCQAFSYAGKKRGLQDARGTLFYHYAMFVEKLKPKMFLAENVKGLVNHDNGNTLDTMLKTFSDIGYQVSYKVLKALDYDVAQKRERIVIIGMRNDLANQNQDLKILFPNPFGYHLSLKDVLKNVPKSGGTQYPESKKKILEKVPPGGYWRDLPEELAKEYMGKSYYSGGGRTGMARRLSWDEPSLTLTCSPAQKQTERCHPEETRPFTVREYARIQSFPDGWEFNCSIGNAYKQIGNAVPVNMAKAIGLSIISVLNQLPYNTKEGQL
ncbi:DNA (cytosine-5-)-methyltransferase [Alkalibacillus silvisoli]|uniref:Cytosine-specific methyltransferase n=1 Tax=Alkalibacillus silvisoli TaxID=392823 RepID=A0ABP3JJL7_9BACI